MEREHRRHQCRHRQGSKNVQAKRIFSIHPFLLLPDREIKLSKEPPCVGVDAAHELSCDVRVNDMYFPGQCNDYYFFLPSPWTQTLCEELPDGIGLFSISCSARKLITLSSQVGNRDTPELHPGLLSSDSFPIRSLNNE
jgi:hypothetical protein